MESSSSSISGMASAPYIAPHVPKEVTQSQKTKELLVVAAKVAVVALTFTAVIAASFAAFNAAICAVGIASAALFGTSIGLVFAAATTLPTALKCRMHEYSDHNLKDIMKFIAYQSINCLVTALPATIFGIGYIRPLHLITAVFTTSFCFETSKRLGKELSSI
jgi:hypothetical protein